VCFANGSWLNLLTFVSLVSYGFLFFRLSFDFKAEGRHNTCIVSLWKLFFLFNTDKTHTLIWFTSHHL
jgi:hypothetical protein